jgi:putative ABC transport system substrate-binding protein
MRRRRFIAACAGLLALSSHTEAAESARRIGFLRLGPPPRSNTDAFEDELRALGYRPGNDLVIERRFAEDAAAVPALAGDLVRMGVDVIVASSTLAALAVEHATATIPIVFVAVADPVASGLVASLAHPGGNATGLSFITADLTAKRFQLLTEIVPRSSCVAVIAHAGYPTSPPQIEGAETAAAAEQVRIELLTVAGVEGFERSYEAAKDCGALLQLDSPLFTTNRDRLVGLAARIGVPAIYGLREFAEAGGLISYGVDLREHYRRAAAFVDRILRGARPADLPVEQPTKLELVINLKAARALGLEVPPLVLAQADEVIE